MFTILRWLELSRRFATSIRSTTKHTVRSIAQSAPTFGSCGRWDAHSLDNDGEPNCSSAEALEEPFVNSTLAQHALALLARLFRYGEISYHGGFINLTSRATSVLRIDSQCWKRTRKLNKHTTPLRRRQEDGSNGGTN
jgi:hypothetical protein